MEDFYQKESHFQAYIGFQNYSGKTSVHQSEATKNENGPEVVEFLDAHLRSNRHNQSLKYRFLMQFQEFEELFEFYQNTIESTGGTKLESLSLFSNLKVPLTRYFSGPKCFGPHVSD